MSGHTTRPEQVRPIFLLVASLAVSAVFFRMVSGFLVTVLLAAVLAGLAAPLCHRIARRFGGRRGPAAMITLVLLVLVALLPATFLLAIVGSHATEVAEKAGPWIEEQQRSPGGLARGFVETLPLGDRLEPVRAKVLSSLGQAIGKVGSWLANSLSTLAQGVANMLLQAFIGLNALFFFLKDGAAIRARILASLPLDTEQKERIVEELVSVSRAIVKGTMVIAVIRGILGGLAIALTGIPGAAFWGMLMAILSMLPAIGPSLVYGPAVVYLFFVGKNVEAIALLLFSLLVIEMLDNFLKPLLVRGGSELPPLLVLLGTLGGLTLFGPVGVVLGPIVAALMLALWDLYNATAGRSAAGAAVPDPLT